MKDKYPMQPIMNGRFESNPIVDWLCTEVSSMNDIAHHCAENDIAYKYQEQLAQLVGYSVGGYGSLSYVSDESYERAENQMNIDNLATQTPEEKEALDSIEPVHLRDYQKADKPRTKVEYEKVTESIFDLREEFERGELHYDFGDEDWFTFNDEASLVAGFKEGNVYRRIEITESPQQREERERLEAAEDLYIAYMSKWEFAQDWRALDEINKSAFLAIVDKTNYRKESNQ